jgi:hypothetical protein
MTESVKNELMVINNKDDMDNGNEWIFIELFVVGIQSNSNSISYIILVYLILW